MTGPSPGTAAGAPAPDSYAKILLNIGAVLAGLAAMLVVMNQNGPSEKPPAPAAVPLAVASPPSPSPELEPSPDPEPEPEAAAPSPIPAPAIDRAAVADAEAALDAASRDRERAEARAADAATQLEIASARSLAAAASARKLAFHVRDPSARLTGVMSRGGYLRAERDKLKGELAALRQAPRPKPKSLIDRNPVARPTGGEELHFEVRRDRVTFIDLDRLLDLVKADAQLRMRIADAARVIESKVGPVGPFSLEYRLARVPSMGFDDMLDRRNLSYDLRAWELVPEFGNRGETFDTALKPVSEFTRTINRANRERATLTMWVYPDGFPLFRKLRDELHARGFTIAARPLPEGMAIRGSPSGSLSAGQ